MPAQISLAFNLILKLIVFPYGYEALFFNGYIEIKNLC
jgi:hypothetical protein